MNKEGVPKEMEVLDESVEPPSISGSWLYRMVASLKTHFSLRPRRDDVPHPHCFYRKSFGIMGFVEFYPTE